MKILRLVALACLLPLSLLATVTSQVDKTGPFLITALPQTIPTGFPFVSGSELLVLDTGPTASPYDPARILTLGSDYTVTGGNYNTANQMQTGNIVVVGTGAHSVAVNDYLVIKRNVPINQTSSFITTGPLTVALLEQMGDKLATLSQQVNEIGGRSLQFENFEFLNGTLLLSARKSKVVGFDSNGAIYFYDPATGGGGGSVTSIATGPGLTGGPITTTGTISQDFTYSGAYTGANTFTANAAQVPMALFGHANFDTEQITGGVGAGVSFGLKITAGTTAADYPLSLFNKAGSQAFLFDGAGQLHMPLYYTTGSALGADQVGNVIPVPGFVNVKLVGAKGDGITNDLSAIQTAINSLNGVGVVYFPPGNYYIGSASGGIVIDRMIKLRGDGTRQHDPTQYTSQITYEGSGSAIQINPAGTYNTEDFEISGLSIKGNDLASIGIQLGSTTSIAQGIVRDVTISRFNTTGLLLLGAESCLFEFVTCLYNNGPGSIIGDGTHNLNTLNRFVSCIFNSNGWGSPHANEQGLKIYDSRHTTFANCNFESNGGTGLQVLGTSSIYVNGLEFDECWFEANNQFNTGAGSFTQIKLDNAVNATQMGPITFRNPYFSTPKPGGGVGTYYNMLIGGAIVKVVNPSDMGDTANCPLYRIQVGTGAGATYVDWQAEQVPFYGTPASYTPISGGSAVQLFSLENSASVNFGYVQAWSPGPAAAVEAPSFYYSSGGSLYLGAQNYRGAANFPVSVTTGTLSTTGLLTNYNSVTTAGWGLPAIYGSGRSVAQNAAVASVATYTVGAADGSFEVSANVLVTTATTHNFTVTCTYTDEGGTSRTVTLTFGLIAGGVTTTAIANANGAVPYMGVPLHIRAKAATAITVATTGTFTTVTYNVEASIIQIK